MVGNYTRKSNRQSWDQANMQRAIDTINNKEMGWQRASKTFGIPQATLRRRVQGKNKQLTGVEKGLGRYQTTFSRELEIDLVSHIKELESRLFGLTLDDVRRLAFQLAERNGIHHRYNKDTRMAGKRLIYIFKKSILI